jgi:uncharacterized membrane protein
MDPPTLLAIAGMAIGTYACRGGGYWLFRQIKPSPFVRDLLSYLPGTLFMGFITPALLAGGPQQWAGAAATLGAMLATRSFPAAIAAGGLAAWAVYSL